MSTLVVNMGITAPRIEQAKQIILRTLRYGTTPGIGAMLPNRFHLTLCNFSQSQLDDWHNFTAQNIPERLAVITRALCNVPRSVTWRWNDLCEGATALKGELWCNIDDDCEPSLKWLTELAVAHERYPNAIVCTRGYPVTKPTGVRSGDWHCQIPVASCTAIPAHVMADSSKDPIYKIAMGGHPLGDDELFFSYWAWKRAIPIIRVRTADWSCKPVPVMSEQPDAHHLGKARARAKLALTIRDMTGWPVPNTGELAFTAIDIGSACPPSPTDSSPLYCCAYSPAHAEYLADVLCMAFERDCIPITDPLQTPDSHFCIGLLTHPFQAHISYAKLLNADPETFEPPYSHEQWQQRWAMTAHQLQTTCMLRTTDLGALEQVGALIGQRPKTLQCIPGGTLPPVALQWNVPEMVAVRLARAAWSCGFLTRSQWLALHHHPRYRD